MKKKILGLALIPFLFSGCPRSANHPINNPPTINCSTIDYGNNVYFVKGDDFGQCLARFVGTRDPVERISFAVLPKDKTYNGTEGYYVIVR